jgi:hypothetical protein
MWAVVALPLALGGLFSGEFAFLIAAAMVTAILLPMVAWVTRAARLIVTPEGVEARQVGANLQSSWENVEEIRLVRGSEGFILREPMTGRGAERFAVSSQVAMRGAPLYEAGRRQLLGEKRFIPFEAFAYWLDHGDLRQVQGQYAPDLLKNARTVEAEGAGPPKLSTARIIAITAIIILSIGAGVLMALLPSSVNVHVFRILLGLLALAMALIATRNFLSAIYLFRARKFGSCLLWGSLAVVQVLVLLAIIGEIAG